MAYFHCLIGGGSSGGGYELTVTCDADFAGTTITATDGVTTLTKTCPSASPFEVVFEIPNGGDWTISGTISGDVYSTSINIPSSLELHYISTPKGSTVLPTDDIQTWLACANITNKSYTTLAEVLADRETFETLIADSNACDYMARSTSWASDTTDDADAMALLGKYDYACNALLGNEIWSEAIANSDYFEEIFNLKNPNMTSNTTPSGVASASSVYNNLATYQAWKAFNGTNADAADTWASAVNSSANSYLQYQFTESRVISLIRWENRNTSNPTTICSPKTYKIQGYNGSTWVDLTEELTNSDNTSGAKHIVFVTKNKGSYQFYRMFIIDAWISSSDTYCCVAEFQLYGRETKEILTPLVPAMTSATTPSGVVYANSELNSNYAAWKAFNGVLGTTNDTNRWASNIYLYGTDAYLSYDFGKQVSTNNIKIYAVRSGNLEHPLASVIHIEGSNDNTTWAPITTKSMTDVEMSQYTDIDYDTVNYRYYRVYFESCNILGGSNDYYSQVAWLQFYQKAVQTNIIHSAANDTIYYLDENEEPVVIATTNSDGDGICDFSLLEDKIYRLYSTVAKAPDNLSNPYSKRVRITKSEFGGTTELYFMPDAVKTLYWWGYEKVVASAVPYRPSDFGGTIIQSPTITRNTTSMSIVEPSNAQGSAIWNNIDLSDASAVKALCSIASSAGYNGANLNVATVSTITADKYEYSGRAKLTTTEQVLSIDVTSINDSRAIGLGIGFTTVTLKFLIAE